MNKTVLKDGFVTAPSNPKVAADLVKLMEICADSKTGETSNTVNFALKNINSLYDPKIAMSDIGNISRYPDMATALNMTLHYIHKLGINDLAAPSSVNAVRLGRIQYSLIEHIKKDFAGIFVPDEHAHGAAL